MSTSQREDGPLAGVKVVSLAINLPGPAAAARLTALGAHVTTVLPPSGDPLQMIQPDWFSQLHAGQDVVTADLKTEQGLGVLHELLRGADLLVTSSRPSALARLGLDPHSLSSRHPHLCHVAIVGHPGDEAEIPGHDLTYQAVNGLINPPSMPSTLIADMAGAERAAQEGIAALFQRERTGVACRREVALSDVAETMAEPAKRGLTTPGGVLGGGLGVYGLYETKDGWVALAALEPHFAQRAMTELGVDGSPTAFAAVFRTRTAQQWEQWAAERDIPLAAVR
jgi:crotonobetainyl-CoA:carnitine CoA-transferase CaiB-like acyl-CoA transferase